MPTGKVRWLRPFKDIKLFDAPNKFKGGGIRKKIYIKGHITKHIYRWTVHCYEESSHEVSDNSVALPVPCQTLQGYG